jgi:hypothetical protein
MVQMLWQRQLKMAKYEFYHKITHSKLLVVRAKTLDEAREKATEMARNQADYRDYDFEDDVYEA